MEHQPLFYREERIKMKKQIRNSCLLVLTAIIWGVAFVAQSEGGSAVGSFSFNGIRSFIGAIVLLPVILLLDKMGLTSRRPKSKAEWKLLIKGGILCGLALFAASSLQQVGITMGTEAGKAGFLTACYILIVPLFGLFLKKKCGWNIWVGVVLTLGGLYLLCLKGGFSLRLSDLLIILCAVCFAIQILLVDHYSPLVDGVRLSMMQFLVTGILSIIPMIFTEMGLSKASIQAWAGAFTSVSAWIPILYAGVLSCGVAYTLQIVGQDGLNPTIASLLMSLESVFSVLAGALILKQYLNGQEILGCVLIFAAIALAQIPVRTGKKS